MSSFKKISFPYLGFMILLTCIPLLLMVIFSISNIDTFTPVSFDFNDFSFSNEHFASVFTESFGRTFARSMKYALIATICSFLIGYPIAYIVSRIKIKNRFLILMAFLLPMWTNMLLRIRTLNELFKANSFLKNVFGFAIDLSEQMDLKIVVVMTMVYLPFMIFPIFSVLDKIDDSLLEASYDLGSSPLKSFFKVTLPLSAKGIASGVMMVFLPCAMGFTIPYIVTDKNSDYMMIGWLIERKFMSTSSAYNSGSLMSLIIIIFVLSSLYLISKIDAEGETLL